MGDPRSVDPAEVEQDEDDVARRDGSSSAPELEGTSPEAETERREALDAMPADAAGTEDQVGEGE